MQGIRNIKVTISTVGNTDVEINIPQTSTGYQLKEYIYQNITKSLEILMMNLYYAGVKIQNDVQLSQYKIIQGSSIKILQTKVQLDQIPGLIVSYEQDQISLEDKTARMPCGHVIGRDCMTQFLRSIVSNYKYKIVCPSYKPNGQHCQMEWQYSLCRKIGVLTKQEIQQFQTGLSKNWIVQNTIECPKCKQNLYKGDLKMNRVVCPRCKYGDFCVRCLKLWKNNKNDVCGNQGCKILEQFLELSPWNKVFKLKDKNKVAIQIKVPQHRACPKCFSIIQHSAGCKHMQCGRCKQSFCWICLELPQNGKWKCGSFNDYCNKIEPTQKVDK